jgi:D-alanyl-D-alanine carboxypeptidase/D-alanyl-D-alanine-endopeptidase (penicillin-binding protein 4)
MRLPQTTRSTRCALGVVVAGALLLAASPTASAGVAAQPPRTPTADTTSNLASAIAYTPTPGDVRMKSALTSRATAARFGTAFSGAVVDAASNTTVWGKSSGTYRMPASTNKLVTASNALTVFGPDKRWTTRVRAGSAANRVILVGAGDPSLKSAGLDAMAKTTAAALLAKKITAARVYVDDDVFPTPSLAYGWKASYVPDSIAPVRGLVRDQLNNADTSAEAGRYFRDRLKAYGVSAAGYYGRANAVSGSAVIASTTGSTLSSIVASMLLYSDNEMAESLHKLVSRQLGHGASWSGARTAQAEELAVQKLKSGTLYDGSGLSRADRITAQQLARIVDRGIDTRTQATLWPLKSGLPTAGSTGTLASRFSTTSSKCAVGKVFAKTGTLSDVVALAGWTTGVDGRVKTFAFLVNGKTSSTTLKQNVDMLAATVAGCY